MWRGVCGEGEVCVGGCVKGVKAAQTEGQSCISPCLGLQPHTWTIHTDNSLMKLTWHSLHSHPQLPTLLQTSSRHVSDTLHGPPTPHTTTLHLIFLSPLPHKLIPSRSCDTLLTASNSHIYPIRPCILGKSHSLKVIIHSDNPLFE